MLHLAQLTPFPRPDQSLDFVFFRVVIAGILPTSSTLLNQVLDWRWRVRDPAPLFVGKVLKPVRIVGDAKNAVMVYNHADDAFHAMSPPNASLSKVQTSSARLLPKSRARIAIASSTMRAVQISLT